MPQEILNSDAIVAKLNVKREAPYYAMYSSWFGGITTSPAAMLIPIDDHVVHRGDGVFEAFKFEHRAFYDFEAHLDRLENSAGPLNLEVPVSRTELIDICKQLIEVSKTDSATMRLYLTRGPGSFTANPYDSEGNQLYIIATPLRHPKAEKYEKGCSMKVSEIVAKETPYSQIKSCNYIQNVLMKKEAVDNAVDFTISVTKDGAVCEGSTENVGLINNDNELLVPPLNLTLRGTTMIATMELAEKMVSEGKLNAVRFDELTVDDFKNANEVFVMGTTVEVLPVTQFEGQAIGSGKPGPVSKELLRLLREDMRTNSERRIEL